MSKRFTIEVPKLNLGKQTFDFHADAAFFDAYENRLFPGGNVDIHLIVDKTNTHIDVVFQLKGQLMLECDRCLNEFPFPFQAENRIVYSFDRAMLAADSEDVVYIDRKIHILDFSQDIYDFISLQVPLRKLADDPKVHQCPPEVLKYLLNNETAQPEPEPEVKDVRWAGLEKFKE